MGRRGLSGVVVLMAGIQLGCDNTVAKDKDSGRPSFSDSDADTDADTDTDTDSDDADNDGYSVEDGDCDDLDDTIHPGADEICDDVDNDCDDLTDDADDSLTGAPAWHPDEDGDGYGNAAASTQACLAPADHVADNDDCADDDATTYPGAAEVCGDGAINDCDGSSEDVRDLCGLVGEHALGEADVVKLDGASASDLAGLPVTGAGDVNGDGLADILVGADRASEPGAAYLILGREAGDLAYPSSLASADVKIYGEGDDDRAGRWVDAAGDVNSDGYDDILVGAWYHDADGLSRNGAVYLITGPIDSSVMSLSDDDTYQAKLTGEVSHAGAGAWTTGIEDLTGDGAPDLLVGAFRHSASEAAVPAADDHDGHYIGALYLVNGSITGDFSLNDAAYATVIGSRRLHELAYTGDNAGDLNGDGLSDVIVGTYSSGEAFVLLDVASIEGHDNMITDVADATLFVEDAGSVAGNQLAGAGDVNGDGLNDILIGDHSYDDPVSGDSAGAVYLLYGTASDGDWSDLGDLSESFDAKFIGEAAGDFAGPVSGGGDVDGDGLADFLIGASQSLGSEPTGPGAVYLFYAPAASGTFYLDTADAKLTGEAWGDKVNQVHNASDVNGDGFADIVIGAPREGEDASGAAYLLFGGGP